MSINCWEDVWIFGGFTKCIVTWDVVYIFGVRKMAGKESARYSMKEHGVYFREAYQIRSCTTGTCSSHSTVDSLLFKSTVDDREYFRNSSIVGDSKALLNDINMLSRYEKRCATYWLNSNNSSPPRPLRRWDFPSSNFRSLTNPGQNMCIFLLKFTAGIFMSMFRNE